MMSIEINCVVVLALPSYNVSADLGGTCVTAATNGKLFINGRSIDVDETVWLTEQAVQQIEDSGYYVVVDAGSENSPFMLLRINAKGEV